MSSWHCAVYCTFCAVVGNCVHKQLLGLSQIDLPSAIENFRQCRRLRQQLEKVRLLLELIKKRERLKFEQVAGEFACWCYDVKELLQSYFIVRAESHTCLAMLLMNVLPMSISELYYCTCKCNCLTISDSLKLTRGDIKNLAVFTGILKRL